MKVEPARHKPTRTEGFDGDTVRYVNTCGEVCRPAGEGPLLEMKPEFSGDSLVAIPGMHPDAGTVGNLGVNIGPMFGKDIAHDLVPLVKDDLSPKAPGAMALSETRRRIGHAVGRDNVLQVPRCRETCLCARDEGKRFVVTELDRTEP